MRPKPSDDAEVRKSELREKWAARATNEAFTDLNAEPAGTATPNAVTVTRHIVFGDRRPCPCSCMTVCGCTPEDGAA